VSLENQILFFKLFSNISGRRSRNFNPSFGENTTSKANEKDIKNTMERIVKEFREFSRGGNIISKTSNGD